MARRNRRKYTPEQKADAVQLVHEVGSLAQVARDLDLTESSLRNWVKQAKIDEGQGPEGALMTEEREELRRLRRENRTLEMEREFLKKAGSLLRQGTRSAYALISAEKANYPIALMCRVLEVSRSGWYAYESRIRPSDREIRDTQLTEKIREVHVASRETYGSPRVHAQLVRDGVDVGRDQVARLMRAAGIKGRVQRRFKVTTDSKHDMPVAPNTLDREFDAGSSDSVWCADITYIRTRSGWVYLAAIIDVATRMIVGWSMATHMRTELIVNALQNALATCGPALKRLHHSDRGCQYTGTTYRDLLEEYGIECSMSRKGNCWDNALMESFFGTYKQEWAHHQQWSGLGDARASTYDYIEVFYNRQRLHSALGYRTPAEAAAASA
ncbi:MAG: IS3 family transposase [Dehalococcoidia bacterium]